MDFFRNAHYGPHDGFTSSATHSPPTSSSWGTRDGHVAPTGVNCDSSCTSYGQWSPFDDAAHIRLFTLRWEADVENSSPDDLILMMDC